MNNSRRFVGLGLMIAVSALAFAASKDPITLKFSPKEGDDPKYKMVMQIVVMGTDATVTADLDSNVTKVAANGDATIVSSTKNLSISFNGQTMSQPDTSATRVSKPNGEIADFTPEMDSPNAWRMAHLNNFIFPDHPVNVGDEWKYGVTSDSKKGVVGLTCNYKLDSLERVGTRDTAKVKITYKETEGSDPVSRDGFVWIDVKDGTLVKSDTSWTNFPSPQGPIDGKITLDRVD